MMIRTLLMSVFLFASISANSAPSRMDIDKLAILLDLDEYQQQQVQTILESRRDTAAAEREAFRASGERPDPETIKAHREEMRAETLAELSTVLSATQIEKFEVLMEMAPRHGPRRGSRDHQADAAATEE